MDRLSVPATINEAEADALGVPVAFYVQLVRRAAALRHSIYVPVTSTHYTVTGPWARKQSGDKGE
jgi:hypothetical protein